MSRVLLVQTRHQPHMTLGVMEMICAVAFAIALVNMLAQVPKSSAKSKWHGRWWLACMRLTATSDGGSLLGNKVKTCAESKHSFELVIVSNGFQNIQHKSFYRHCFSAAFYMIIQADVQCMSTLASDVQDCIWGLESTLLVCAIRPVSLFFANCVLYWNGYLKNITWAIVQVSVSGSTLWRAVLGVSIRLSAF